MRKYLIKTRHLGLRFIREEDVVFLKEIDKDPAVKQFFPEGTLSTREIKEFIAESIELLKSDNLPCFVIFKLKTGEFVGEAYFGQLETGETKIGYLLHKKYWHRGYATEVVKGLINWANKHLDIDYLFAFGDKNNTATFRVLEKCGLKHYKDDVYLDMESRFYRIRLR